ncbi:MAG: DUF86 domain-containing protein [Armatimonadota bacterium]|nr:DUF86 domain-containing protein [bacterium]MDW8322158.1 DUF86 domain-containing protein [Armatimonadota bacterium]
MFEVEQHLLRRRSQRGANQQTEHQKPPVSHLRTSCRYSAVIHIRRWKKGCLRTPEKQVKFFPESVRRCRVDNGERAQAVGQSDSGGRSDSRPWRGIAGLRDSLAHAYFGLDAQPLWGIRGKRIPLLLETANQIDEQNP